MKKVNIFIGIGIIIIVIGLAIFSVKIVQPIPKEEAGIFQETAEKKVVLVIDESEGAPKTFEAKFRDGMTAFDLLKNETEKLNIFLKTKTYDIGIFIEAIGDKENGQGGKYWLYYVNGEIPMVSADKEEIKAGDRVEFKFEKSPF